MIKRLGLVVLILLFVSSMAWAHHPAADIVDDEIYAMIDDMVSDTPHGDMVFDEEMGVTTISDVTVNDVDDMIRDGLLDAISVLDGTVTVTITFPEEGETLLKSIEKLNEGDTQGNYYNKEWSEWERPVLIQILQEQ